MAERPVENATRALATAGAREEGVRRRRWWGRWRIWLPGLVAFLVAGTIWQLVAIANPYIIPTLDAIAISLARDPGMYWANFLVTLLEVVVGATIGIVVGLGLAIMMAEWRLLERAVMPLAVVVMVTPIVAIAPALVVAFGFGMMPKFVVTALVVFFPILVNSLAGLRSVDRRALDVLRTVHASRPEILWRLRLPGSMPYFFAGLRIALPLAVVGAAVAEFSAAGRQAGLGSLVMTSAAQANLPVTWASITLLCVLGVLLIAVLAIARRRVLWWDHDEVTPRG